jgi:hypothetical protein
MQNKFVYIDEKEMECKKNIKKLKSTPQIHPLESKVKDTEYKIYDIRCFNI